MKRTTFVSVLAVGVFMLMLGVPTASADFFSTINVANCSSPNCLSTLTTGPYGTVDVHWISTTLATITFTADAGYLFGDSSVVDVNINGTFTASAYTGGAGFAPSTTGKSPPAGTVDGFGVFNLTFNQDDGWTNAVNTASFTVTATGATTWTDAASVLAFNSKGWDAAAHIFVCTSATDCTSQMQANGVGLTGYAAEGTGTVPDGGVTLMLLGGVLVGVETLRRRLRV